jgi:hypothetical protein
METVSAVPAPGPRLRRTLTLWDLILYGIIVIQPTAPMPAYGVFSNAGQGHVVTSILIAMVAMVFTAMSYGRMARVYPSAGSAYTYVGRELHPSLGYVTGWSMTDLHHLVREGHGRFVERNALSASVSRPAVAADFCRSVYRAQPARSADFGANQ